MSIKYGNIVINFNENMNIVVCKLEKLLYPKGSRLMPPPGLQI